MFTGIVEAVGEVESLSREGELVRLRIRAGRAGEGVSLGDSVAVNGVCLTVTAVEDRHLGFDAVRETLDRSALGDLAPGARVNLERAMRADGRLDGHIVQGHVDGVGRVRRLARQGDDVQLFVECDPELAGLLVDKGSVTIDGVSLTVVRAEPQGFDVVLIPHTLAETTLSACRPGQRVNLEADILGKYVKTYLDRTLSQHLHSPSKPSETTGAR
jgi:riboflavin synthase